VTGARLPGLSIAELAAGAARMLPDLDSGGQVPDPFITVDLDSPASGPVLVRAASQARSSGRILAGVGAGPFPEPARPLLRALDLTLAAAGGTPECVVVPDPAQDARVLATAAAASPQASLVLRQVLKMTSALPAAAALEAESLAYSALLGGPEFGRWLGARGLRKPAASGRDPVLLCREGPLLRITLNHPERRNAYSRALRDALADALRVALADPSITRVTLGGAGPCFSSGGDLDEFGTTPDPVTAHLIRTRAGAGPLIGQLGRRIEVRAHGPCVGAGVELAAFAGTVTAAEDATFRLPEVSMGLIPGAGGTVSLPRRIGRWRTLYLALSGQAVSADTALDWGLADGITAGAGWVADAGR
jgi:enoyl-CoA hydratase/carnithine racemase